MRNVPGDDEGAREGHPRLDRVLRERGQDVLHRLVEVDLHDAVARRGGNVRGLGQEAGWVLLQLLNEDALLVDPRDDLPVRAAGDAQADGARSAVPRQSDDTAVVGEVLAAELRAHPQILASLQQLGLPLQVAKCPAVLVPRGRQVVVVASARELHGLQVHLCRGAADDHGDMVWRACGGSQRLHLLLEERLQLLRVQQGLRLLVEVRLVGGTAALGHEQELVLRALLCVEVDLCGQIRLRVPLGEHRHRRHLGVAQVPPEVCLVHAFGQVALVIAICENILAALAHDDGGARVLASWEHTLGGNDRVLKQVPGGEPVVVGRLRIRKNLRQLPQVTRPQEVLHLCDAVLRQLREDPRLDVHDRALHAPDRDRGGADALAQLLVPLEGDVQVGLVLEHRLVDEGGGVGQILHILAIRVTHALVAHGGLRAPSLRDHTPEEPPGPEPSS
mmetsp:Transcript_125331/g.350974  ORF Transcript_125331/g.350974 Transcript_125331/m.350974 type:complete len:447 (+) Transcript_125331:697-2037(+)